MEPDPILKDIDQDYLDAIEESYELGVTDYPEVFPPAVVPGVPSLIEQLRNPDFQRESNTIPTPESN